MSKSAKRNVVRLGEYDPQKPQTYAAIQAHVLGTIERSQAALSASLEALAGTDLPPAEVERLKELADLNDQARSQVDHVRKKVAARG